MRLDILISYSYSESKDKDLYVTGDLYENDVVTPAMIVVPRRRCLNIKLTKIVRLMLSDLQRRELEAESVLRA
ncbi:hypothetical protein JHK86_006847 [Glycine max]|nr:hypothetical protein JHK86_006847 [Glycine max]